MCTAKIKQAVPGMIRYCAVYFTSKVGVVCTALCRLALHSGRESFILVCTLWGCFRWQGLLSLHPPVCRASSALAAVLVYGLGRGNEGASTFPWLLLSVCQCCEAGVQLPCLL